MTGKVIMSATPTFVSASGSAVTASYPKAGQRQSVGGAAMPAFAPEGSAVTDTAPKAGAQQTVPASPGAPMGARPAQPFPDPPAGPNVRRSSRRSGGGGGGE